MELTDTQQWRLRLLRKGLEPSRDKFLKIVTSSVLRLKKIPPIYEEIMEKNESIVIIAWIRSLVVKVQQLDMGRIYRKNVQSISKTKRIDSDCDTTLYLLDALQIPCQPGMENAFHRKNYPRAYGTNFFAEMTQSDVIHNVSERMGYPFGKSKKSELPQRISLERKWEKEGK